MKVTSSPPMAELFRGFMSAYFTGVTIVTSADAGGRPHGLTCTSLTSVTLSPPTLLVCLNLRSGTLAAIRDRGTFVVNLLHDGGRRTAERFASPYPDRFDHIGWQPTPHTGLPWLAADAQAIAECRVTATTVVGDHAVVLGEVEHVSSGSGSPLLYGAQTFCGPRPLGAS